MCLGTTGGVRLAITLEPHGRGLLQHMALFEYWTSFIDMKREAVQMIIAFGRFELRRVSSLLVRTMVKHEIH
jgi:hypothetical protein